MAPFAANEKQKRFLYRKLFYSFLSLFILGGAPSAEARVFQFGNESFAAYLRGSYWAGSIKNTLFSNSNTTAAQEISVENRFLTQKSGELGFLYGSPFVNLKGSIEMLMPTTIIATAKDAAETDLYDITSSASILIPKIGFELNVVRYPTNRMFVTASYGSASLTAQNAYTFTSAGSTAFGGIVDFTETLKGSSAMIEGGIGYEFLFVDTTTVVLEGGYRSLKFTQVKFGEDVTNLQGSSTLGGVAVNTDGTDRTLDLSGPYMGFYLRFWIDK